MQELRIFSEWLRPEKSQLQKELEEVLFIYKKHSGFLELATSEEKVLLRKYGYQPDPIFKLPPVMIFRD